jgi:hypothetical protein
MSDDARRTMLIIAFPLTLLVGGLIIRFFL